MFKLHLLNAARQMRKAGNMSDADYFGLEAATHDDNFCDDAEALATMHLGTAMRSIGVRVGTVNWAGLLAFIQAIMTMIMALINTPPVPVLV